MSLHRPRRIFRANLIAAPRPARLMRAGPALGRAFGVIALALAVAWAASDGSARLRGWRAAPRGEPARGAALAVGPAQVAVVDGDTLRLDGTVVRLLGIAAPPRGRRCADPQGTAYDCGAAASEALGALVRNRPVACRLGGSDAAGLVQGECEAGGTELAAALVSAGWARATGPAMTAAEAAARAGGRGVWRGGSDPGF